MTNRDTIVPPRVNIARAAASLFGLSLGHDDMANVLAEVVRLSNGLGGGEDALANRFCAELLGAVSDAGLARLVMAQMGLAPAAAWLVEPVLMQWLQRSVEPRGSTAMHLGQVLTLATEVPGSPLADDGHLFQARIDAALARAAAPGTPTQAFLHRVTIALTPGVDSPAVTGLDDVVFAAYSLGGVRTLQGNDRLDTVSAHGLLQLQADATLGPLALPGGSRLTQVTLQSRAGPTGERSPVQLAGEANFQRIDFLRSEVDVDVTRLALAAGQLPQDVIVALVDTTAAGVDHRVAFAGLSTRPVDASQLQLQLLDVRSAASADPAIAAAPLRHMPFEGFRFVLNGEAVTLMDRQPGATDLDSFNGAQTHAQLLQAVRLLLTRPDNLQRWHALEQVTAELGPTFEERDGSSGRLVSAPSITLRVPVDSGLTLVAGSFMSSGAVPADGSFHFRQVEAAFQRVETPAARILLDHVAADGLAGNLTVGAVAGEPYADGIDRFEIVVDRDSTLATISSTGDALREVVVRNGLDRGRFTAWGSDGALGHPEIAVGGDALAPGYFGFNDVRLIDLSALQAPSVVDLRVSQAAAAKYAADPKLADGLIVRGGSADDALSLFIDGRLVGYDAFKLGLHGGAGNDRLELVFTEHDTTARTGRITVVPGPGDDVVLLPPRAASVRIVFEPGFGDDEIRFFGPADQLDLRALGGDHLLVGLRPQPQAGELTVQAGAIILARGGAATMAAAGVAARFADLGTQTQTQQQVYLTVDSAQQAQVWQIDDPVGAGNVSATLVGSITLPATSWAELGAGNFG